MIAFMGWQGRHGGLPLQRFLFLSPTGHLVYMREAGGRTDLYAMPFDLDRLTKTGEPFLVAENAAWPSVSADGTLVYRPTATSSQQLVWVDRTGKVLGTIGQPQNAILHPALSPDGRRVAAAGLENDNIDIWIHDVVRGTKIRLTSDPAGDIQPAWSPTGDRIAFMSFRSGAGDIFIQAADGSGTARPIVAGPFFEAAPDWSRDGHYLAYHVIDPKTEAKRDLWYVPLTGEQVGAQLYPGGNPTFPRYTVTPDGQRFVVVQNMGQSTSTTITVVQNWVREFDLTP